MGSSESKIESNGTIVVKNPNNGKEVVNKDKGYTIGHKSGPLRWKSSTMGAHQTEADADMHRLQLACTTVSTLGAQHTIESCTPYKALMKK